MTCIMRPGKPLTAKVGRIAEILYIRAIGILARQTEGPV